MRTINKRTVTATMTLIDKLQGGESWLADGWRVLAAVVDSGCCFSVKVSPFYGFNHRLT
jgi:hypothetical protein